MAAGFGSLGTALTQAGNQAGTSARGFDQATQSLKQVKKASDDVGGALGALQGYFKQLGSDILRFGGAAIGFQALKSGVEGLLDSATKAQSLTAAFTAIGGSAQEGQKQLDFVRDTADKLGFSFTALAQNYKGLSAASRGTTLEGQATRDIFTAVATASRVLQLSTQDTGGVLLALQQIVSKGVVQSEELRGQIGERLPGAFGIAARAMGVTEKELTKLLESGSVAANVFIPRFAAQLQKEFAGGAENAAKTFAAATERLGNAFQRLGEEIARSGVLEELGKILDKLTGIISAGPKAADAIRKVGQDQTTRDLAPLRDAGFDVKPAQADLIKRFNEQIAAKQAEIDAAIKSPLPPQLVGSGLEAVYARGLKLLQAELAAIEKAKAELLRAVTRAVQAPAIPDEGFTPTAGISNRYARAQDLQKTLATQAEALKDATAALDRKLALAPGSLDAIMQERAEVLKKARAAFEDLLASRAYKDLAPLLQVLPSAAQSVSTALTTANAAFKGANPQGLATALPFIQAQAPTYGLDPSLVAALVYEESRFNPLIRSRRGALGLGQLMPDTAAGLGVTDRTDIQQNLTGTFKYLQQLTAQFKGNIELILAAYNAGPGAVRQYRGIPPYAETQKYVPKVLARQQAIQAGGVGLQGPLSPVPLLDDILQQEKGVQAYIEARKMMVDLDKQRQHADEQAAIAARQEGLAAMERLQQMASAVQPLKEARDQDIAALLVLKVQTAGLADEEAKRLEGIILTGARIKDNIALTKEAADRTEAQGLAIYKSINALQAYQEQLELSGGAVDAFGRIQRTTAEARAVTQAERQLKDLPPGLQAEGAQVIERLRKAAKEATPLYKSLTTAAEQFADSFLSTIEQVTQGGIKSFKQFADSVIQDLLRIVNQQFLKPALSGLIEAGIKAGTTALGIGAAGGADFGSAGPSDFGGGGGFAAGGPVYAGQSYWVGERGAEPFIPAYDGRILSREDAMTAMRGSQEQPQSHGKNVNIHSTVNIYAQDVGGVIRSQGQVRRVIAQNVQDATRNL